MQSLSGTYALVLQAFAAETIQIGRLGPLRLRPGYYIYVGSAFGPGGVKARVGHHCGISKRPRWHIDYLRARIQLVEVWCTYHPERMEDAWARACRCLPEATTPLPGFGASDRRGDTHLVFTPQFPDLAYFRRQVEGSRAEQQVLRYKITTGKSHEGTALPLNILLD